MSEHWNAKLIREQAEAHLLTDERDEKHTRWMEQRARAERAEGERDALRTAFDDIIVWAARYAHGRSTYAPSDVRRAVAMRKAYDPQWVAPRAGLDPIEEAPGMLPGDDLTDVFPGG